MLLGGNAFSETAFSDFQKYSITTEVAGLEITVSVGSVTVPDWYTLTPTSDSGWTSIAPTQDSSWTEITPSQNPNWTSIN